MYFHLTTGNIRSSSQPNDSVRTYVTLAAVLVVIVMVRFIKYIIQESAKISPYSFQVLYPFCSE